MQKSVLTEIMLSLSKKEVRDLNKWLQSPSHNQREDVVKLFDYLVKYTDRYADAFEKTLAWKAIFPNQPYDDAFMRQIMHFLLKAIEEYLVFTDFTNDRVQYQISLTRTYRKRKLEKSYKLAHRLGSDYLQNQPLRNDWYLLNNFFLTQEEHEHKMSITQNAPVKLQETADALEKWFIEERLRVSKDMLAHHRIYQKITYDHGLLEETLAYVEKKQLLSEPSIAIYYFTFKALTNPSEETYFDKLEHLIHNEMGRFKHLEIRTLYLAALNYCVSKINQGRQDFASRAFVLYRKGLETHILLENDTVSRYTFGNAVGAALRNNEFEWAEKFIRDFKHHLDEKERNSIVNFNLSRVYFEQGDYDKAQDMLTRFEYDDMLFNIIAKTMLLKIYHEKEEFDAFESLLESMRTYLQRKEALDPARKTAYKNMISLMKKLLHLNIFSKTQREKFKETVVKTNPLAEREWLLKQIE
jgi:hypothetical protein